MEKYEGDWKESLKNEKGILIWGEGPFKGDKIRWII